MTAARRTIGLRVNGLERSLSVAHDDSLLDVIGKDFGLTGPRESCGQGVCGSCTVLVDGGAVSACLFWAVLADGTEITTVEGLGTSSNLHPVQEAFISHSAFQCGFCTPGMIVMVQQLLIEEPNPTEDLVRRYLSGNICRCAAYPEIICAVLAAAQQGEVTHARPR